MTTNEDNMKAIANAAAEWFTGKSHATKEEALADIQTVFDWQARHMIRHGQQALGQKLTKAIRDGVFPDVHALADGLHWMIETPMGGIWEDEK